MNSLNQLNSQELTTNISPEMELLLCCARTQLDLTIVERVRDLLAGDIDFTALLRLAALHRVKPLLHHNITRYARESIPPSYFGQMQESCRNNSWRNMYLVKELVEILELFKANEIRAFSFKGPVLAASVYGNLSLRQISDLDFLVEEQNFQRAVDLLISQGYEPRINVPGKTNFEAHWEIHLVKNSNLYSIDLHQTIVPKHLFLPLSSDYLWENQELLSLAGTLVTSFTPEANLLILCLNGSKDLWQNLSRICDVAELIRAFPNLSWQQIIVNANKSGFRRNIFLGLSLARNLLDAKIPYFVWQQVQSDPLVFDLSRQIYKNLFAQSTKSVDMVESTLFCIKTRERWQDKAQSFFGLIKLSGWLQPSPRDRDAIPLPAIFSFVYYLYRPIRVGMKYRYVFLSYFSKYQKKKKS